MSKVEVLWAYKRRKSSQLLGTRKSIQGAWKWGSKERVYVEQADKAVEGLNVSIFLFSTRKEFLI